MIYAVWSFKLTNTADTVSARLIKFEWMMMIDCITVSWIACWLVLRLLLISLEKLSSKFPRVQTLYYFSYPYEGPTRMVSWGVLILFCYPLVVNIFDPNKTTLESSLNLSWTLLEVGVVYGFKVILLNMAQASFFKDITEAILYTSVRERWVVSLEQGTAHSKESSLLLSSFSNKKITDFLSEGLKEIEKVVLLQGNASLHPAVVELADKVLAGVTERRKDFLSMDDLNGIFRHVELNEVFTEFDLVRILFFAKKFHNIILFLSQG